MINGDRPAFKGEGKKMVKITDAGREPCLRVMLQQELLSIKVIVSP
jgi:hypothetical protein